MKISSCMITAETGTGEASISADESKFQYKIDTIFKCQSWSKDLSKTSSQSLLLNTLDCVFKRFFFNDYDKGFCFLASTAEICFFVALLLTLHMLCMLSILTTVFNGWISTRKLLSTYIDVYQCLEFSGRSIISNINCLFFQTNSVGFQLSGYYRLTNEATNQIHAPW